MTGIETPRNGSETPSETLAETDRHSFDLNVYELRKNGQSIREIARILNCSPSKVDRSIQKVVTRVANNYGLRSISREEIHQRIFNFAPKAVQQIQRLATSARKEEVQLKASADILDRAGFAPVQKNLNMTFSAIEEMSQDELVTEIRRIINTGMELLKARESKIEQS